MLHDERGLSILKCSILWWITPILTFIYNKNPSVYQSGASKSDCCAPPLFKEMLAFVQMSFVWTTKFYLLAQLMLAPLHCTLRPNYLWIRKIPLFFQADAGPLRMFQIWSWCHLKAITFYNDHLRQCYIHVWWRACYSMNKQFKSTNILPWFLKTTSRNLNGRIL